MTGRIEAGTNPCESHEVLKPTAHGNRLDSGPLEGVVRGERFRNEVSEWRMLLWVGIESDIPRSQSGARSRWKCSWLWSCWVRIVMAILLICPEELKIQTGGSEKRSKLKRELWFYLWKGTGKSCGQGWTCPRKRAETRKQTKTEP